MRQYSQPLFSVIVGRMAANSGQTVRGAEQSVGGFLGGHD
jgi:hypothetical protein